MFDPQFRWLRLGAFVLCSIMVLALGATTPSLAAAPAKAPAKAGKGKGKKPAPGPKNPALSNALNDKGAGIQQCAADHGLDKGGKKVDVDVRVTIRKTGEVVDTQITATVDGAPSDAVKDCVEKLVRGAKFPAVPTPLATAERSWSVASQ